MSNTYKDIFDFQKTLSLLDTNFVFSKNSSDNAINNYYVSCNSDISLKNLKYIDKKDPKDIFNDSTKGTEILTDQIIKEVFEDKPKEKIIDVDECREKLYLKKNYSQKIKKELFSVKLKKNPGRQRPRNNSKKERHDNASNDNILTKVQIHYINFIRNASNDVIKAETEFKVNPLEFKDINYDFKKCINYNYSENLKKLSIKEILCNPISNKYKKLSDNKNYNQDVYDKVTNKSKWLKDFFETNYKTFFYTYYNNCEELKKINFLGKDYNLSKNTKSFYELINKEENIKIRPKLIENAKLAYFNKKDKSTTHNSKNYFQINK